ncbi:MAG: ABC transporter substrate-binding protein [Oscillospiraceae bacterium]
MKQLLAALLALTMLLSLAACAKTTDTTPSDAAQTAASDSAEPTTLTYGSADYTRINPAMDEHGEINLLLFDGLTAHDGENNVVPGLAETWELDEATNTYTFHLRENLTWHDGEPVTADDVKFTIEAIMDPENGSENAPNFEDVEEITVTDDHTVSFRLSAPNVAFLDYMTMAVLPEHLLAGEDMAGVGLLPRPGRHRAIQARALGRRDRPSR